MLGYSAQAVESSNLKQATSLLAYSPSFKEMMKHTKSKRNGYAVQQRRKSKRSRETRKEYGGKII
jgi:hypothetical protein